MDRLGSAARNRHTFAVLVDRTFHCAQHHAVDCDADCATASPEVDPNREFEKEETSRPRGRR